jgi:hypothetical protein
MVRAAKGYPFVCMAAESLSIERRRLMRFVRMCGANANGAMGQSRVIYNPWLTSAKSGLG